jgi:uncharacterized protein YcfL
MKTKLLALLSLTAALFLSGCGTHSELLDPGVKHSLVVEDTYERELDDGRLEVTAKIRNLENRRIEVQINCVFTDRNQIAIGDETPFQTLILTENATESVTFTSANKAARKYNVRIRQAR